MSEERESSGAGTASAAQGESPSPAGQMPAAPLCVGICMMDENGYCIGCGRTAEELLACFPGGDNEPA